MEITVSDNEILHKVANYVRNAINFYHMIIILNLIQKWFHISKKISYFNSQLEAVHLVCRSISRIIQ